MAQPVGGEWNSRTAVQRETMPRVIKKVSSFLLGRIEKIADGDANRNCADPFSLELLLSLCGGCSE